MKPALINSAVEVGALIACKHLHFHNWPMEKTFRFEHIQAKHSEKDENRSLSGTLSGHQKFIRIYPNLSKLAVINGNGDLPKVLFVNLKSMNKGLAFVFSSFFRLTEF